MEILEILPFFDGKHNKCARNHLPVVSPLFFGVHVELDLQAFRDLLEQRHFFPWNTQSHGQIPNVITAESPVSVRFARSLGGSSFKISKAPGSTGFGSNFRSLRSSKILLMEKIRLTS